MRDSAGFSRRCSQPHPQKKKQLFILHACKARGSTDGKELRPLIVNIIGTSFVVRVPLGLMFLFTAIVIVPSLSICLLHRALTHHVDYSYGVFRIQLFKQLLEFIEHNSKLPSVPVSLKCCSNLLL